MSPFRRTIVAPLLLLAMGAPAFGQQAVSPEPSPAQAVPDSAAPAAASPAQPASTFSQAELDQMLAPIALYPDSLLTQILMASTYPLEVVTAARWSKAHSGVTGQDAVKAADSNTWDPSVKSLVAFPQILAMMDEKLEWTERLGEAFVGQQPQVMETVQNLRKKAQTAGNLKSDDHVNVTSDGQTIAVQPTNPEVVYVPYYSPTVVYGPWWWDAYPPVYWGPWRGYGYYPYPVGYPGFWWGGGIFVGGGFFFGVFDWRRHYVYYGHPNFYFHGPPYGYHPFPGAPGGWAYDPGHRLGVPFTRFPVSPGVGRPGGPPVGSPVAHSGFGGPGGQPPGQGRQPNSGAPGGARPSGNPEAGRSGGGQTTNEPRPHAYEGVGHGQEVRNFSQRGHASRGGFGGSRSGGGRRA